MKIGIISEYFPKSKNLEIRGGAEARAFHIAKILVKNNEVTVITSREDGRKVNDEILGIKVFRVGKSRKYTQAGSFIERFTFIKDAIKIGKKQDFDIIEGTNFLSYPVAWKVGEYLAIPKVITYHDVWIGKWIKNIGITGIFGEILERYTRSKKWNTIIANSNYTQETLRAFGFMSDNIITIHNGVDLEKYRNIKVEKFEEPTICTISRLVKYKKIDDLIKAVSIIQKDISNIKLKIIGTGPEEVNLKKLVNKLNLRANVEFLGFIENHDDVIRQLKASDVFALPSIVEGFGMVVIEAMAAGIPYVASDIPPIREVTSKGIGGLLFEPTNCEDLALKVKMLLKDESLRAKVMKDGNKHVENYEWTKMAREVEKLYDKLINQEVLE
ncbi:MAG: glycosyltransferase family 4 protein [Methanophagales archaeon]|nr:glycosyltransferase family 4 protein [Methanophagales archaeon]MCW3137951.1 glycosyltransferase family 4 protein [Methanophagales archaeon]MCW7073642.1 glycosyltransferase family 4 protein [Methanophagales archaeon]